MPPLFHSLKNPWQVWANILIVSWLTSWGLSLLASWEQTKKGLEGKGY